MAHAEQVFHLREREKTLGFAFAVKTESMLYVSGTCAQDAEGNAVGAGDMETQLRTIYGDIQRALEAHDVSFAEVVRERIFVTDIEAFRAALPARTEIYGGVAPPAATWVEVSALMRPEYLIEVEVTAILN